MSQLEKATLEYQQFTQEFQSIIISTVNDEGMPNGSYTPFVMDECKNIYIYVSGLSPHTQNINLNNKVNVLFIEDEAQTPQIFARRRLNYDCTATLIERETETWLNIVEEFETRFGEIIELLRGLPDFRVFKLTPHSGRFVIGFGQAYHIDGDNLDKLVQIGRQ
ncbi:pyridoxamine 5'-phosphate oxidase-related FMN-binding protein [Calothrix parasitica NIES-267]|uniref:Pyridoxamine 5'-phosphate oxidase-related FMN-binding protein n=1 Tax=Calothrix parasitica NIES-267 TaxID=1973488 RepID=A0A1Z4M1H0_9CYAN|nr:pyridoxamine 5'-phosphate oxidase-related FMN-binding protein [Calothrix parasitica NIES-267]